MNAHISLSVANLPREIFTQLISLLLVDAYKQTEVHCVLLLLEFTCGFIFFFTSLP